jgi:phenylalanyl-tRNA synthetase beta chain
VALFESAHVYEPAGPLDGDGVGSPGGQTPASEAHHLAALLTQAAPGGWRTPERPADFFAAKALLEGVLQAAGLDWSLRSDARPFLHPGRAASVLSDGGTIGWVGELHPLVARAWDLDLPAAGFEIDLDALGPPPTDRYRDVTSFPAVLQDIAVVVADDVPAASVVEAVRAGGGELLARVSIFDLYRGEQVGEGRKSLALRLEFRAADRTLTDGEVSGLRAAIERQLGEIGGHLRA